MITRKERDVFALFLLPLLALIILIYMVVPPYFPYRIDKELVERGRRYMHRLIVVDLEDDGVDEIISVWNKDYKRPGNADYVTRSVNSEGKFITINNYNPVDMALEGRGDQVNSTRKRSIIYNGVFDVDDDGVKELYYTERTDDSLWIRRYELEGGRSLLLTIPQTRRCRDRNEWDALPGIVGITQGRTRQDRALLVRIANSFCPEPREIFKLDPDNPETVISRYPMGAWPARALLTDLDEDGFDEVMVLCDGVSNRGDLNGTVDSLGYVIVLDKDLSPLWMHPFDGSNPTVYAVPVSGGDSPMILALVWPGSGKDRPQVWLFDAMEGKVLDTHIFDGGVSGVRPIHGQENGFAGLMVTKYGKNVPLRVTISERSIEVEEAGGDSGLFAFRQSLDILGDDGEMEYVIRDKENNDIYIVGQSMKRHCRIDPEAPDGIDGLSAIRCSGGARKLIYLDGDNLVIAGLVENALAGYLLKYYGIILVYLSVLGVAWLYRKTRRPDQERGRVELLEHLSNVANHDRLSIVKTLELIVRRMKIFMAAASDTPGNPTPLRTALNNYNHKASEDLHLSLKTMEEYGLYPEAQKQLEAAVSRIDEILESLTGLVDSDCVDTDVISGGLEPLASACRSVEMTLDEVRKDLDERLSSDLLASVKSVLDAYNHDFQEKGIQYEVNLIDEEGVECDFREALEGERPVPWVRVRFPAKTLMSILDNLVSNAERAVTGVKGKLISVRIERLKHLVEVTVEDTGCGIDPEFLPSIFYLGPTTKGRGGTGLFHVRRAVERFGGSIEARSDGEGKGAAFKVVIPRASQ